MLLLDIVDCIKVSIDVHLKLPHEVEEQALAKEILLPLGYLALEGDKLFVLGNYLVLL